MHAFYMLKASRRSAKWAEWEKRDVRKVIESSAIDERGFPSPRLSNTVHPIRQLVAFISMWFDYAWKRPCTESDTKRRNSMNWNVVSVFSVHRDDPRYHTNAPKVAQKQHIFNSIGQRRSFQWNGNRILSCVCQPVSVAVALWSTAQFVHVFVGAFVVCSPSQFNGTAHCWGDIACRIESDQATRVCEERCVVRPFSRMCSVFGCKKNSKKRFFANLCVVVNGRENGEVNRS